MGIIDTKYYFSGDFQGQEEVRIIHQCALYNPKYGIDIYTNYIIFHSILKSLMKN
jgi:hypothetical protein